MITVRCRKRALLRELWCLVVNTTLILFLAAFIPGCDYGVQWRDKPYEVIWVDTFGNRALSYDLGGGMSIGRVEAEVIAVGSNDEYVVAKQRDRVTGNISYFYIERSKDDRYYNGNEIIQGPFSESRFSELKLELNLPGFSKEF